MKKILIVEDDKVHSTYFKLVLEEVAEITLVESLKDAETVLDKGTDFDAVIMDGCLGGHDVNTVHLVRMLRESFSGPIVATSSDPFYNEVLVNAGCSHSVNHKADSAKLVLSLLA